MALNLLVGAGGICSAVASVLRRHIPAKQQSSSSLLDFKSRPELMFTGTVALLVMEKLEFEMTHEETAIVWNFTNRMLQVRDMLDPIVKGEIERGHCLAGNAIAYGGHPGMRKTTLKDAKQIARHVQALINMSHKDLDEDLD